MPYIIVIEKNGTVKEINIKEYNPNDLYKKANFKSSDGFSLHHKWEIENNNKKNIIAIYGKINGKSGQENKYEFPPPIDTILFFGGCVLVNENPKSESISDLRIVEWKQIYEKLMGGFEDLEDEDNDNDNDEEDLEEPNEYVCDDFLVEDDAEIDYDNVSVQEEEEEEEEIHLKKGKKNKKKDKKTIVQLPETNYLDCQSELEEEEYFA